MTSLSGNGAEPKSSSSSNSLIASRDDLNLAGQSRYKLGRNVARLIKDNKLDMDDIQNGLNEIQERERMAREALLQAVSCLPAYEAERIVIEKLEKNLFFRGWLATMTWNKIEYEPDQNMPFVNSPAHNQKLDC
ncbi:uncharacterized protein EAF02_006106 [Botrytis sinoallii]|uniref:uncharacterized protein n=1 Tax=Botrytis sinoallii TaxID=1463999 RepID=UPI0018FFB92A|nr:uncharacterized protein EAF02_006106 [Botrytis sinoallii]KAF7882743.1 hypothetical protein EAF02_006106 [Botrytis sinoallii]